MTIIGYICIGVIFNMIVDLFVSFTEMEELRFTWIERFAMVFWWPVGIVAIIIALFKN
jgi:hypothetical protein